MRVLVCWSNISGYMAACWRALAARPGVELRVIAFDPVKNANAPFDASILRGIECTLVDPGDLARLDQVLAEEETRGPDAAVVPGWFHPAYVRAARRFKTASIPVFMTIDHGWEGTLRQRVSVLAHRRYIRGMAGVFVGGERARQYALKLGARPETIHGGLYGFDAEAFSPLREQRSAAGGLSPRVFLFVGRYVEAKGLDVLVEAYRRYRERVEHPWALSCCGRGPQGKLLAGVEGVTDHGFTQPSMLVERLLAANAFVLPSRFEPWGVALAEAAGSGLPILCSQAVGAAVELVHDFHNGRVVPTSDSAALASAMAWLHHLPDPARTALGDASAAAASAYSAERWADRWADALREAVALRLP